MKPVKEWLSKRVPTPEMANDVPIVSDPPPAKSDLPAELGDRVRDPISGFTGIVVVVAQFLNGCARCGVQPETMKDGLPQPEQHFDQAQLEVVVKNVFLPMMIERVQPPGGPERDLPRAFLAPPAAVPSLNPPIR